MVQQIVPPAPLHSTSGSLALPRPPSHQQNFSFQLLKIKPKAGQRRSCFSRHLTSLLHWDHPDRRSCSSSSCSPAVASLFFFFVLLCFRMATTEVVLPPQNKTARLSLSPCLCDCPSSLVQVPPPPPTPPPSVPRLLLRGMNWRGGRPLCPVQVFRLGERGHRGCCGGWVAVGRLSAATAGEGSCWPPSRGPSSPPPPVAGSEPQESAGFKTG